MGDLTKLDGRQLTTKLAHHKQRVSRFSPIFSDQWAFHVIILQTSNVTGRQMRLPNRRNANNISMCNITLKLIELDFEMRRKMLS